MQPWQLNHQVLQADNCGRSVSFQAALGFPCLLRQTGLGVFWSTGKQLHPWFPVVWSSSASSISQALQVSHNEGFPPTWLGDCFSALDHEVCALAVSSSGDLSFWEETWRQRQLCSIPAYDQCSSLHWASLWCVVRLSCHAAKSGRSPEGASVWSMGVSMLPWTYPSAGIGCLWWWAHAQNGTPEASTHCHCSCQFCVYLGFLSTVQSIIPLLCWSLLRWGVCLWSQLAAGGYPGRGRRPPLLQF